MAEGGATRFGIGEPVPRLEDRRLLTGSGRSEAGNVGMPAAIVNAVIDALAPLGVKDVSLPATPENVWRAIRDAAG